MNYPWCHCAGFAVTGNFILYTNHTALLVTLPFFFAKKKQLDFSLTSKEMNTIIFAVSFSHDLSVVS